MKRHFMVPDFENADLQHAFSTRIMGPINRFEKIPHLEVLFPSTSSELISTIVLYRQSPSG